MKSWKRKNMESSWSEATEGGLWKYGNMLLCVLISIVACADDWRDDMWKGPVVLRDGVTARAYALEAPRNMKAYVVSVDLTTPGVGFTATERAKNWGVRLEKVKDRTCLAETRLETTADFMMRRRREGANVEVAFNTTPWEPFPAPKGENRADPIGWCVTAGEEVSRPEGGEWVFAVHRDGRAGISQLQPGESAAGLGDMAFVAAAYDILMTNGVSIGVAPVRPGLHPRTALGLADGGRRLVVLAVDGRQPGYSDGADFADLCDILKREGVTDAVNMDGGGSTALVVWNRKTGAPWTLNRHARNKVRATAFNLGIVFAEPAADGERLALERTASVYHSYEFEDLEDTPPPQGFSPFYIGHFGRHGSRRLTGSYVPDTLRRLEDAGKAGKLTDEGEELLAEVKKLEAVHAGMTGQLSERGAQEHRMLARRMAARFPEIFKPSRRVRCQSTPVPRVLMSAANFTMSLQEATAAKLDFDCLTGGSYVNRLSPADGVNKGIPGERKKFFDRCAQCKICSDGVVARIFKSPDAVDDARRFARDLFVCASICQCVRSETGGVDLYRFFTKEEIAAISRCLEMEMYGGMANSPEFGDVHVACTQSIADDFVKCADGAISDDRTAADLRFGHDSGIWPFAGLIGLEGPGDRVASNDAWRDCPGWKWMSMASNIQMVLYRNDKGDVLAKVLYNEREMHIRGLEPVSWPYYRWPDIRDRLLKGGK